MYFVVEVSISRLEETTTFQTQFFVSLPALEQRPTSRGRIRGGERNFGQRTVGGRWDSERRARLSYDQAVGTRRDGIDADARRVEAKAKLDRADVRLHTRDHLYGGRQAKVGVDEPAIAIGRTSIGNVAFEIAAE